jgi:hypothetical protein
MANLDHARRLAPQSRPGGFGPALTFGATVLLALCGLIVATAALPRDFALAATSSLFFVFAALVALVAWGIRDNGNQKFLSYWDVAGALTLIGICAATLMDSDQLVRLIESQRTAE